MADTPTSPSSGAAAPVADLKTPWTLRLMLGAGIAVPVGMLVHLSDLRERDLEGQVDVLEVESAHLGVENERLGERAVVADRLEIEVAERQTEIGGLRGQIAALGGQVEGLKRKLGQSERRLDVALSAKSALQGKVSELESKVASLGKREEALQGIIDLLEGEVASAERRLEKLAQNGPQAEMPLSTLGFSEQDGQVLRENDRLRNELRKHDDQLVELLAEISALNQELEIARGERSKISREAEGSPARRTPSPAWSRRSRGGAPGAPILACLARGL